MAATKNPVALAGGDRAWDSRSGLGALTSSELTTPLPDIQMFRAAWMMRRHKLAPAMARAVADLAFSTREAGQ